MSASKVKTKYATLRVNMLRRYPVNVVLSPAVDSPV